MLQTRKSRVIFVTPITYEINLTQEQLLAGMEIKEHIVADVVCFRFLCSCYSCQQFMSSLLYGNAH